MRTVTERTLSSSTFRIAVVDGASKLRALAAGPSGQRTDKEPGDGMSPR
jgi:hypothetical protein